MTRGKRAGAPVGQQHKQSGYKVAGPGSILTGTLKPGDLIHTFMNVLNHLDEDKADNIKAEMTEALYDSSLAGDIAETWADISDRAIEQLTAALNDHAPKGHYFGAHPGDGADFGFWSEETADEDEKG